MQFKKVLMAALMSGAAMQVALAGAPSYTLVDLGPSSSSAVAQGLGVSSNGSYAVGTTVNQGPCWYCGDSNAMLWGNGGATALPNLPSNSFAIARGVNNSGIAVGTLGTTAWGQDPQAVKWVNGQAQLLSVPAWAGGMGHANAINNAGMVVGDASSSDGLGRAQLWDASGQSIGISASSNGSFMTSATGISGAGPKGEATIVGLGVDPSNASLNVGLVSYLRQGQTFTQVLTPTIDGANGVMPMAISSNGFVTGVLTLNQGSIGSFIWSEATGMKQITPLGPDASFMQARGVNSQGWAVGTIFGNSFLYDGKQTYDLQTLLSAQAQAAGWTFNDSSGAASAISDNGIIIGTASLNGQIHAVQLIPTQAVPEPASYALMLLGMSALALLKRRRSTP
ncbi:hypothetical protein DBR47_23820 [Paucibacter sp. KBW04]|uniref:PEP-CTERM sorting domain-containing protein n=1 Tax=Paucibacter sp. KBW04 TaxID=2153361 RepID=UPI000F58DEBD|nr:PEP-CTERM sorting domain-containing protein [Paucibacter sp. KBW04]RQO53454.1 hypothetical protein DBR47_23820 [Paucibacter sp. KBW04]